MANQNYYSDASEAAPETAPVPPEDMDEGAEEAAEPAEPNEQAGAQTAVVQKTALPPDVQPGQSITARVLRVHENGVELSFGGESEPEEEMTPPPGAMSGMAGMME